MQVQSQYSPKKIIRWAAVALQSKQRMEITENQAISVRKANILGRVKAIKNRQLTWRSSNRRHAVTKCIFWTILLVGLQAGHATQIVEKQVIGRWWLTYVTLNMKCCMTAPTKLISGCRRKKTKTGTSGGLMAPFCQLCCSRWSHTRGRTICQLAMFWPGKTYLLVILQQCRRQCPNYLTFSQTHGYYQLTQKVSRINSTTNVLRLSSWNLNHSAREKASFLLATVTGLCKESTMLRSGTFINHT